MTGLAGVNINRDPHERRHLQGEFMIGERRDQADDPLGDELGDFGKRMAGLEVRIWQLIETAGEPNDTAGAGQP